MAAESLSKQLADMQARFDQMKAAHPDVAQLLEEDFQRAKKTIIVQTDKDPAVRTALEKLNAIVESVKPPPRLLDKLRDIRDDLAGHELHETDTGFHLRTSPCPNELCKNGLIDGLAFKYCDICKGMGGIKTLSLPVYSRAGVDGFEIDLEYVRHLLRSTGVVTDEAFVYVTGDALHKFLSGLIVHLSKGK